MTGLCFIIFSRRSYSRTIIALMLRIPYLQRTTTCTFTRPADMSPRTQQVFKIQAPIAIKILLL